MSRSLIACLRYRASVLNRRVRRNLRKFSELLRTDRICNA